jgi:hypothetical protein
VNATEHVTHTSVRRERGEEERAEVDMVDEDESSHLSVTGRRQKGEEEGKREKGKGRREMAETRRHGRGLFRARVCSF